MTSEATRKFHFIREIASGGFGSVYLAKVIHGDGFSRLVAVKLLHPKWSENEEIASRMRDEARLLGWLRHKNIVDVMDLTLIDGRCAVLMEYLEAVDLKVIVTACLDHGARIPLRVCLEVCSAVASALDAAYTRPPYAGEKPLRVIHRDIKPSNIMVDEGGTTKVLDFGVARADFEQREAKTQELSFGSIEYMPPERLFFEPESPASDVYSLGATLYEMLALDKLGKAKLRPPEQERFIEDRFDDLLERHPMPSQEVEDILHDLLFDMLGFNEADRPSAADCVSRMRSFARKLTQQETIGEWCEQVIPPLHRQQQKRGTAKETTKGLVGKIIIEDTSNFVSQRREPVPAPPPTPEAADEGSSPASSSVGAPPTASLGAASRANALVAPGSHAAPSSSALQGADASGLTSKPSLQTAGAASAPAALAAASPAQPLSDQRVPTVILPGKSTNEELAAAREQRAAAARGASSSPMLVVGVVVAVVGVLASFALAVGLGAGGVYYALTPPGGPLGEGLVVEQPAPVPAVAPEVADPKALPSDGALFVSKLSGTKKLSVRCTGGKGDGGTSAAVEGEVLGRCMVTAVTKDRSRSTAVIDDVEHREYACFVDGENLCE